MKMEAEVRASESQDQHEFDELMKDEAIEKARLEGEVDVKSREARRLGEKADSLTLRRSSVQKELEAVTQYRKDLEPACEKGDSTYEDRKKAREDEIEALNQALQIFKEAFEKEPSETGEANGFLAIRRH